MSRRWSSWTRGGERATAYALRSRRLVDTPRRDGGWAAVATGACRFYVEHGHYPDSGAVPARQPRAEPTPPQVQQAQHGVRPTITARPDSPDPGDLISEMRASDGVVRIASPDAATRAAWRRAIHAAKENGLVPDGFHLRHRGRDHGDLVIELVSGDHPGKRHWTQERRRLDVPDSLTEPHPVVATLRREERRLEVSSTSRDQALRLIQALVAGAEQQGHIVACPTPMISHGR